MTLMVVIFILGVLALRMGDGAISFLVGVGLMCLVISMSVNTALENPELIPHKKEMAEAASRTKQIVKQLKDEIDDTDKINGGLCREITRLRKALTKEEV